MIFSMIPNEVFLICTWTDLGSLGLEPCWKLGMLVKRWIRKRWKFQFGQYCQIVNIMGDRTLIDVIPKRGYDSYD